MTLRHVLGSEQRERRKQIPQLTMQTKKEQNKRAVHASDSNHRQTHMTSRKRTHLPRFESDDFFSVLVFFEKNCF
jgi:hypothetical protein